MHNPATVNLITAASGAKLFLCCPVKLWETMPSDLKAIASDAALPYERIECSRCRQPVLMSNHGRTLLDEGSAEAAVCTDCILGMSWLA